MKNILFITLAVAAIILFGCQQKMSESIQIPIDQNETQETEEENDLAEEEIESVDFKIEPVVEGLDIPWDMAFTSEERILVTERSGKLRVVENGALNPIPLHTFPEVSTTGEEGLMSIVLDPDYEQNKWVYLSWAYEKGGGMAVKVSRFKDAGDHLEDEFVVIDNLPAARFHAGCRLEFGPDGKLYITVGDALNKQDAQNLESLAGKILRLNKDGSIPSDNPFPNSPIWTYGHRNAQGIAWNPETNEMYESEHGPSVIDGPAGGDEINHIVKGKNYGWPLVSHDKTLEGMESPLTTFTPAEAPASLLIYSGDAFPQFKNNLFFGALNGEGLVRLELNKNDPNKVAHWEKVQGVDFGRIRNVMEGPDGFIYFSTSNRDGRGGVREGDDKIFRIVPSN